jgi:16S rRNA (uracil1498-N3)-methyltransferase
MPHRFFTTTSLAANDITLADEAQVHQISRVLRLGLGDTFVLNENNGEDVEVKIVPLESAAQEKHGGRSSVLRLVVVSRALAWRPVVDVEIGIATIRKERFEWALEKCTELGVSSVTPIATDRAERGSVPRMRAERILKEASEQCGRGSIPVYGDVATIEHSISTAVKSGRIVLACVHNGSPLGAILSTVNCKLSTVLIGPEGGWTPAELALFKKHAVTEVSLGPTNLRAETAAVAACALVHMHAK